MLTGRNKLIVELKATVVRFQTSETLRMKESLAAQDLLKQQYKLIESLQQLNGRQVVKKVKPYNLYYSVKQVCHGSSTTKLTIPRIVFTPPSPSRRTVSSEDSFAEILAAIPKDGVYKLTSKFDSAYD